MAIWCNEPPKPKRPDDARGTTAAVLPAIFDSRGGTGVLDPFPARLYALFTHPTQLYRQLREKSEIAFPLLFQLATLLFLTYALLPQWTQQLQSQLAGMGISAATPVTGLQWVFFVVGFAFTALITLVNFFLSGLLLVGLGRALQIHLSFAFCVSLFAYCQIPIALRNVINGLYALRTRGSLLRLDLGLLWTQESGFVQQVLRQWDPFVLWSYVLLGFGLAAAAPDHRRRAGVVVVAYGVIAMLSNALLSPKGALSF
ncbi:MAG: YIP1 family protein [Firmicutes bacterium]|nr:YIP1 family protein [Bacillota bacterium]